ncbi:MAG: hypothetical protein LC117_05805 [Bacteroidia bacterium]|nr:hypothetical protein [Bacteroidia bacterium]MCZ2277425.1 hypothetical protein [Bacteroidia bacterium]
MNSFWYGIESIFEFIFNLVKPIGMTVDVIFIIIGFVGAFYWMWYTVYNRKGGHNFMSHSSSCKKH